VQEALALQDALEYHFGCAQPGTRLRYSLLPKLHKPGVISTSSHLPSHNGITKCIPRRRSPAGIAGLLNAASSATTSRRDDREWILQLRFCYTSSSHTHVYHNPPIVTLERRLGAETTLAATIDHQVINTCDQSRENGHL
jgi:hypothetical protein